MVHLFKKSKKNIEELDELSKRYGWSAFKTGENRIYTRGNQQIKFWKSKDNYKTMLLKNGVVSNMDASKDKQVSIILAIEGMILPW